MMHIISMQPSFPAPPAERSRPVTIWDWIIRGRIMWCCGQIDVGFCQTQLAKATRYLRMSSKRTTSSTKPFFAQK
jgi:hypothetical protein